MADVVHIGPGGRRPLLRKLVGDVLRRTRREQGRTLADVARDARVSMPYLSEIERGRKEASSEVLGAVCGALKIELADLLADVRHELIRTRPAALDRRAAADRAAAADRVAAAQAQPAVAEPKAAQSPMEPTASVVSLDAARLRRSSSATERSDSASERSIGTPERSTSAPERKTPATFGDVVLLAA
jgi:transcriptional regulator with XRE-family HTH domain